MVPFLQDFAAVLFAGFAIIISVFANREARRANKRAERLDKEVVIISAAARKTELLVEIERKNAAVGKLTLITARKLLLLQKHPELVAKHPDEDERLRKNLELMQEFKDKEEEQRRAAESYDGMSVLFHQEQLAYIKRLCLRLEADIEKEAGVYEELAKGFV